MLSEGAPVPVWDFWGWLGDVEVVVHDDDLFAHVGVF